MKKTKGTAAARKHASETQKAFFSNPENRLKRSIAMKGKSTFHLLIREVYVHLDSLAISVASCSCPCIVSQHVYVFSLSWVQLVALELIIVLLQCTLLHGYSACYQVGTSCPHEEHLTPDALQGWNSSAANVGKKVIGASIAQQWEKFQAERISDADYVGERVIIAEHVESQSQRMSVNDNLGTAANVVKGGTTVVTVPDPPPLRLRLVLLAI